MKIYDVQIMDVRIKWSRNKTGQLYKEGFKYCSTCGYMIRTLENFCIICGKKFRFNKLGKKKKPFTESRKKPIYIYLNGEKYV